MMSKKWFLIAIGVAVGVFAVPIVRNKLGR